MVTNTANLSPISSPLEDYLETIYLLVQKHGFARVKDIAKARDVKAATVTIALRKLSESDLVHYERREYIGLTTKGEEAARRILTRHRLLTRFFEEVLTMSPSTASEQACVIEHCLTDEAMDRLVRFFEFLGNCPSVIENFRQYSTRKPAKAPKSRSISDLKPGQSGIVTHINAQGALRQRLLDMGILPETLIELERSGLGGDPLWIRCQGARLALRRAEANTIRVREEA